jgi:DNA-binding CsgD family transcriptional regulator
VLNNSRVNFISRITALIALGRVYTRQGETLKAQPILEEALQLADQTNTIQRLGPARALRAEAAWLKGDLVLTLQEASAVYDLAVSKQHPWLTGELAYWRKLAGVEIMSPAPWLAKPYHLQLDGNWAAAAAAWEELGCPYEQARALAEADDMEAHVKALAIFEQLGAQPLIEQVRHKLQAAGMQSLPRGPRPTTRGNPFNLTNRQLEILTLLMAELTNAEIAARLHISPKTVDHHVSAVLTKMNVSSREEAAELARPHPYFNSSI